MKRHPGAFRGRSQLTQLLLGEADISVAYLHPGSKRSSAAQRTISPRLTSPRAMHGRNVRVVNPIMVIASAQRCTRPLVPSFRSSRTSSRVERLKSPRIVCFSAEAAAANSVTSCKGIALTMP